MYLRTFTLLTIVIGQICTDDVQDTYSRDPDLESLKLQVQRLSVVSQENHQKIQDLENLYMNERNERLALEKSFTKLQYSQNMTAASLSRGIRSGGLVFSFHATLTNKFTATQDNQAIPFDLLTADTPTRHIHYNKTTGIYTCPVEGYYYFTWTIGASGPGTSAETSLMKNTEWLGMLVAYNSFASSSSSVVVHLQGGDKVWVSVRSAGSQVVNDVSSFLGFKLSG